jgi:hypothetical protein
VTLLSPILGTITTEERFPDRPVLAEVPARIFVEMRVWLGHIAINHYGVRAGPANPSIYFQLNDLAPAKLLAARDEPLVRV